MHLLFIGLFPVMWTAYLVYWQIMARNIKAAKRMESAPSRALRAVLLIVGCALMLYPFSRPQWLHWRLLPASAAELSFFIGAAITAAGLAFSVWARVHLGRNWSHSVTIKQDHDLIVTGPYALVRHPIYTGMLTGFLGTAIALAELRGLIAFILVFLALWIKLRLEEQWMREYFGTTYETYSHQVAALVPMIL
ncbi:MAG: isoprenylcysteine carboxylmethyltransferase family protein [Acidobacteriaceae bacterium]